MKFEVGDVMYCKKPFHYFDKIFMEGKKYTVHNIAYPFNGDEILLTDDNHNQQWFKVEQIEGHFSIQEYFTDKCGNRKNKLNKILQ